jgi:hypothetical protein
MLGTQQLKIVRQVAGLAGLVLFSLPAFAQNSFLSAEPIYSVAQPALRAAIESQPAMVPAAPSVSFLPDHPAALGTSPKGTKAQSERVPRMTLRVSQNLVEDRGIVVRMAASFEEIETPFLNQVRVPLVSVLGGRVELSGFQSVAPMVNLLWGLPLKASAYGASAVQQCHPGIRLPRDNQSYGLSLRFRFSKQDADRAGNGLWSAARHAVSWSRAFFTL